MVLVSMLRQEPVAPFSLFTLYIFILMLFV
jgi:hypothetical protein